MPLATWMLKGFFDGIPKELDEAAMIDGANRWRAFIRVVLPIARPGLTAVFVIMALLAWAEFVIPYILLTGPSHLPIAVGILNFQGTYATNSTGILAAGSVIAVLPAILLFVVLQRFIVGAFVAGRAEGLSGGGVPGDVLDAVIDRQSAFLRDCDVLVGARRLALEAQDRVAMLQQAVRGGVHDVLGERAQRAVRAGAA